MLELQADSETYLYNKRGLNVHNVQSSNKEP